MANPLLELSKLGQSIWYDNLSRELLRTGELRRMIEQDGISGVTSNPTIFEKAIGQERIYENDIHALVDDGMDANGIYESLAVVDIRDAADLLKPVYKATSGGDGYVSLEVSPSLAYDKSGTVTEVRRLFSIVDRRNLMIKVPATPQGIEAVRELIAAGININVTLIFSLEQYRNTATAYIEGIEEWIASGGEPNRVASVASFFVSRVDTLVDERLNDILDPRLKPPAAELMGKAAIANARMAYALYKEIVSGERFVALASKGARRQRLLWGSTSTKNPNYPDTYYADSLIGAETVNTMPTATVKAYRDHGNPAPRLEEGLEEACNVFPKLESVGVDMREVMDRLLEDGVKAFADSYDALLEEIRKKRTRLLRGWGHRSASLGALQKPVDEVLARLDERRLGDSVWNSDVSVWSVEPETGGAIRQRLGWLQVVETMVGEVPRLRDFADDIRSLGFQHAVLLGMGGSSLASEVFATCFGPVEGYLDLKVLDTTVPGSILDVERGLDLDRTLFIVSSKSGGTIEVVSLYNYFRDKMDRRLGEKAGGHFIAITDPGTGLGKLASEHGFRRVFLNPPDVGGRFSALSYFGLVPAALVGADVGRLLMRASQAVEASGPGVPSLESPGVWLGVIMAEAAAAGRDKLTLMLSPQVETFGLWLEQLVAESTGKQGKGIIPIVGEQVGSPEVYGNDRLFVYLRIDEQGIYDQQVSVLEKAGHPVVTLRLHGPYDIGREMFRWEFATAVAGALLGINPFDEPNVQEAKDITNKFLKAYKNDGKLPAVDQWEIDDPDLPSALTNFFKQVRHGDYLAFNVFLRPGGEDGERLQSMRDFLRDKFKIATAVGFGPRYLHSTGQIHKGGADNGCFILVTDDEDEDIQVPGESYSFGVLKSAQSMGDYAALKKRGRRALNIHLRTESDLGKLLRVVKDLG